MQSDVSPCHLDTEELLSGIPGEGCGAEAEGLGRGGFLLKDPKTERAETLEVCRGRWWGTGTLQWQEALGSPPPSY